MTRREAKIRALEISARLLDEHLRDSDAFHVFESEEDCEKIREEADHIIQRLHDRAADLAEK